MIVRLGRFNFDTRAPDRLHEDLLRLFWDVCGWIHARSARAVLWSVARVARVLAVFPWSCRLAFLCALMAGVSIRLGTVGAERIVGAAEFTSRHLEILEHAGVTGAFDRFASLLVAVGLVLLVCAVVLSFIRRPFVLAVQKAAVCAFFVLWSYALFFVFRVPCTLHAADAFSFDKEMRNQFILGAFSRWLPVMGVCLAALLCVMLVAVRCFYGGRPPARIPVGDRILANMRTLGRDPRFRTSLYWAAMFHILIFVVPVLMGNGCGFMKPYAVPKGSGEQVIQKVVVKRIKKKEKKLVLNMNSPILYYVPDLKDSRITQELDQETLDTYQASSQQGGLGKGGGKGGWPNGMENARVRFIRLEYAGGDWDQDMGKGADYNFLLKFRELTGFKIAEATEHISIGDLRRFPAKRKPPFVFVTGRGGMQLTVKDVKTLRTFCLEEGGMVFADNGGGNFNASFRAQMRRVFPELDWIDIANDDIIFRVPFLFPAGAPPFWHHSGSRAMGMKYNGRWVIFYHQGDVNDAWKTGHSGASAYVAEQAYRLGVNVVNYAFNQYMNINYGD